MVDKFFEIPKYKGAAVYGIVNIADMKIYIGVTQNVRNRAMQHLHTLKRNKHANKGLQADCEKGLRFIILYKLSDEDKKHPQMVEQIYMLAALGQGYELYNDAMKMGEEHLRNNILFAVNWMFQPKEHIEKSIKEEYGIHTWDLRRTKRRDEKFCR